MIRVFAGRTATLLVLSRCGSFFHYKSTVIVSAFKRNFVEVNGPNWPDIESILQV